MRGTTLICLSKAEKGTFNCKISVIFDNLFNLHIDRPEGQHPKQFRLLIVKQTKLQSFQWD